MVETDMSNAVVSNMTDNVSTYEVDHYTTDAAQGLKESFYINNDWSKQLGYFKKIPELNRAITALSIWTVGKGYTTKDKNTEVILKRINGWGCENFVSILVNLLNNKKAGGDSFAEIIRNDKGILLNLKTLDPGTIKTVVNSEGQIIRYEQVSKIGKPSKTFNKNQILHLSNDRAADEIHGTSIVDVCQWVIDARNEAMTDQRKVNHRNVVPVRIIEVDTDKPAKMAKLKSQYEEVINKGEVIIVPKGNVEIKDSNPVIQDSLPWIKYLENFFYQAVGIPRVIATSEDYTESGSKVGFLTFEPVYTHEQTLLERDLWNQLAIEIKFNRPPSLGGDLNRDEAKDGQTLGVQPSDTQAGVGR